MEIRTLKVGTVVKLEISDPFDIAQIISGEVLALDSAPDEAAAQNLLVRLRSSILWKGRAYDVLALRARHSHRMIDQLIAGEAVACNGVHVAPGPIDSPSPWGAQDWRGGLAVITSVKIVPE